MNKPQAFVAGVTAGIVMTVLVALARVGGLEVNLEMLLGTLVGLSPGFGAWMLGFLMHLGISGLIAIAYAAAFEYWMHRADWRAGLALSVPHMVVGGFFLASMPSIHPLVPEVLREPGPFMAGLGVGGFITFVVVHMVYGSLVGGIYDLRQTRGQRFDKRWDQRSKVA